MAKCVSDITGKHFGDKLNDSPALDRAMIIPKIFNRIDLERRAFISVADRGVVPELAPAMFGARWFMPLMSKVSLKRNAFGLIYIHGTKLHRFYLTMVLDELIEHPCIGIGMGNFLFECIELGFKGHKIIIDGFEKG